MRLRRYGSDFSLRSGFQKKPKNEPRGRARGKRKRCGTAAPGCAEDPTSMWIAVREFSYGGYRYHLKMKNQSVAVARSRRPPAGLRVGFSVTAEGGCATPFGLGPTCLGSRVA